ncbi:hypothetical protein [Wolbachia endosymbiont of Folsomia candida]|uniref:hypothetical protein n=1 Tax=Wolbachia endosymbiont of Folsomia candida TaxID=169402 RepID=UPI000AF06BAB|nr:hypothetical protein [Wolbachia endosymbiont of Folsomia candida]APR98840.1 hypothetical protein ASM33_06470 [Wolbachia endosymbiont of Folsomia candida]
MKTKPEPFFSTIIKNHQKPSLLERLSRFIATPFVEIYNSIKSRNECRQEIPSNFTDNSTSSNLYLGNPELIDEYVIDMKDNPLDRDRGSIQTKPRSEEKTSNEFKKEEKIDTPSLTVPELSKREKSGFFQTFKRFMTKFFTARAKESATVYHNAKSVSALGNGDYVSFTEIDYPPLSDQPLSAQPFQERRIAPPTSHEEATQEQPNSSVDGMSTEHTQTTQGKKQEETFVFYI